MAMAMPMSVLSELPTGFRFHPTDEELIVNYLQTRAAGQPCPVPIVADVDIYKYDPWHLPAMALFGDREWYFFSPRDRKYPNGLRPNRSAASGFWKATGTDKLISLHQHHGVVQLPVAVKKALVFYVGRPPTGTKTPWIMHEYRLLNHDDVLSSLVLCRIFSKTGPPSPPPDSDLLQELLPASVIHNSAGLQLQDDCYSDMYSSGVLLAIQEELPAQVMYQCECHHKEGEAISEITTGDVDTICVASTAAATHHLHEGDSNGAISDSEQQIDSMHVPSSLLPQPAQE